MRVREKLRERGRKKRRFPRAQDQMNMFRMKPEHFGMFKQRLRREARGWRKLIGILWPQKLNPQISNALV